MTSVRKLPRTTDSTVVIEQTIEEIRKMRSRWDLSHVIFAFPQVKTETDETWRDPSPFIAGCMGAAENSRHPEQKNLPYAVRGIAQIEFNVTKTQINRLMKVGVFTIYRHKSGFRITLPPEVRGIHGKSTIAIVGVPPFHLGAGPNMQIVEQMQSTCRQLSEEQLPKDQWKSLPRKRIEELKDRESISRRDVEDTRLLLWIQQGGRCTLCHRQIQLSEATLEHELPKAMHGPNTLDNLSVTCRRCNEEKGNSLPVKLSPDDPRWKNYVQTNWLFLPKNSTGKFHGDLPE